MELKRTGLATLCLLLVAAASDGDMLMCSPGCRAGSFAPGAARSPDVRPDRQTVSGITIVPS